MVKSVKNKLNSFPEEATQTEHEKSTHLYRSARRPTKISKARSKRPPPDRIAMLLPVAQHNQWGGCYCHSPTTRLPTSQ